MKRVLVIDDDEAVRDAFELALDEDGFEVRTAPNGEAGVAMAAEGRPDLVFLDLKMPKMDGVDVLRALHELDASIPVYIVTAFHEEFFDRLNKAMEDGIPFQLARKPLTGDQIRLIAKSSFG